VFLTVLVGIVQFFAVALAMLIAHGFRGVRPTFSYRPVAYFFSFILVADYVRWAILPFLLDYKPPFTGLVKIVFCVYESLYWAWMFGAVGLAVRAYLRRSVVPVAIAYISAVLALFVFYPRPLSGSTLNGARLGLHAFEALAVIFCFVLWLWRKPSDLATSIEHRVVLVIGGMDSVVVFGPYLAKNFDKNSWDLARVAYVALYLTLIWLQGGHLWRSWGLRAQRSSSALLH